MQTVIWLNKAVVGEVRELLKILEVSCMLERSLAPRIAGTITFFFSSC